MAPARISWNAVGRRSAAYSASAFGRGDESTRREAAGKSYHGHTEGTESHRTQLHPPCSPCLRGFTACNLGRSGTVTHIDIHFLFLTDPYRYVIRSARWRLAIRIDLSRRPERAGADPRNSRWATTEPTPRPVPGQRNQEKRTGNPTARLVRSIPAPNAVRLSIPMLTEQSRCAGSRQHSPSARRRSVMVDRAGRRVVRGIATGVFITVITKMTTIAGSIALSGPVRLPP
jgi:hypothetical protein